MKRLFYIFTFFFVALSAMAADITGGTKLYLKPNANWKQSDARFAAYFFNNSTGKNTWVNMTYIGELYEVITPTGTWANVIFCRMNPSTTDNNWDTKWNQTSDLTYDGTKNCYTVKEGTWDKGGGTWSKVSVTDFSQSVPFPIFLKPSSEWNTDNARFAIYCFGGGNDKWVDMIKLETHSGYYSALLPEGSWEKIIFCRMDPSTATNNWDNKWNQTADLLRIDENNCYAIEGWGKGSWSKLTREDDRDINSSCPETAGGYYQHFTYTKEITNVEVWHWISLPFDVKISDIKGAGDYGDTKDFVVREYDSDARANWTSETVTWKSVASDGELLAGKGYILGVSKIGTITFKSSSDLNEVKDTYSGENKYSSDAIEAQHPENDHWHLIGTGLYSTANGFSGVKYVAMPTENGSDYSYYFLSNATENGIFKNKLESVNPYTAFFVQNGGEYSFSKQAQTTPNNAPRRAKAEEIVDRYYVNIAGAADTSHTAIFLAEDGSDDYVVGKDFLHFGASGASLQLYTLQSENTLSFNYLKREDRTVLVGGYVAQSGKYTISLVAESDASSVLLYDATTGLAVDLLNENYEFEAEKGTLDGRFSVIISYAAGDGPATMIGDNENESVVVSNNDGIAYFEGLSVGESVVVYDVVGRCVTQFVAENDEADVMLTSGVYMLYHNGETVKFVVNR